MKNSTRESASVFFSLNKKLSFSFGRVCRTFIVDANRSEWCNKQTLVLFYTHSYWGTCLANLPGSDNGS